MKTLMISTLVLSLFSLTSAAQTHKHDFTLSAGAFLDNGTYQPDFGGMYRYGIAEGLYLKAGYSYFRNRTLLNPNPQLIHSSDSLSISRTQPIYRRNHTVRIGVDFEKVDLLVLGASIVAGYRTSTMELYDRAMVYNEEEGAWNRNDEATYAYYNEEIPLANFQADNTSSNHNRGPFYEKVVSTTNFLLFGIELNAGIRVPLGNRLEATAQYTPQLIRYQQVNATQFFAPTEGTYKSEILSATRFNQRVMVGLRIKI